MVITGIVWSCVAFSSMYPNYRDIKKEYLAGEFSVVDGTAENFHPMPFEGHQDECFTVRGVEFCYSDFIIGRGFNNSTSYGGPIRAGLPVRISYIGNNIVRLEIRSDSVPSPAESKRRWLKAMGSNILLLLPIPAFMLAINIALQVYKKILTAAK